MSNHDIINDGTAMLRWQVITMLFVGIVLLITIIFQVMEKVAGSFLLSVSRQGIIFLIILVIAYHTIWYMEILISQAATDILTAILAALLFRSQLYKEFHSEDDPLNILRKKHSLSHKNRLACLHR